MERIEAEPSYLTGIPLILATIAVSIATFLIVLDYSIANVSIPYIAGDLAVSADQGTYVITSFAVGSAIALPITGWLSHRIGMIRLTIFSMVAFSILSWVCGISWSLSMLVISRFLQGLAAGPLIPMSQSLIVRMFPGEKKNAALGFWSTVVIVAPIIGPILGGWISYDFSWPWIFFINIPFGLISALIIFLTMRKYETTVVKTSVDWIGLLLLAVAVSCLQFLLDKGQQFDWLRSPLIRFCICASTICFTFLFAYEFFHKDPILELRLLKIRSYALSILFIGVIYAIYFGTVILIPLWLQEFMGYTPIWAGVAVAPIGIIPFLFTTFISKMVTKTGPFILLGICMIAFSASSFITAYMTTDVDIWHIMFSRLILGLGLLFFIVPLFSYSIQDLTLEQLPSGTGMFHFVRALSGGIGTSVFTTLWIRRSAFHHANLVSQIHPDRLPVVNLYDQLTTLQITGEKAQTVVNNLVDKQATLLAINDCFFLMGWIFIGLIAILFLGKKKKI